jgi:hypothetical protein
MKTASVLIMIMVAASLTGVVFCDVAAADTKRVSQQTIYLPVYLQIDRSGNMEPVSMAILNSIRNTDSRYSIQIVSIDFFDGKGALKKHIDHGVSTIGPLEVKSIRIEPEKLQAGSQMAGSFIIKWRSNERVTEPICEAIVWVPRSLRGGILLFTGQVIDEK